MNVDQLKNQLPDYAKDTKLNISTLLNGIDVDGLTGQQLAGIALASAYATRQSEVIAAMQHYAQDFFDEQSINSTKIAANLMAMNNVYYRFAHVISDNKFLTMPAKLRMSAMANPGIDKISFELYALAVSAINGCAMCMDSHVKSLQTHGVSDEAIQTCVRLAAVVNSLAQAMVN